MKRTLQILALTLGMGPVASVALASHCSCADCSCDHCDCDHCDDCPDCP